MILQREPVLQGWPEDETIIANGIPAEKVFKLQEGRPNIADLIMNGQIQLVINTPSGKESAFDDSYIRKTAIKKKIPYMTTMAAAMATAEGIKAVKTKGQIDVCSLQEIHKNITE